MLTHPDVNQLIRDTQRYEFSDGLRDLQLAALFLAGGAMAWLSFEPGWLAFCYGLSLAWGRWAIWILMLPTVVGPLVVLGFLWVMRLVRQRWLWRDSGTVTPQRWLVPRSVNIIGAVILIVCLGGAFGLQQLGRLDSAYVLRMFWAATGWSFGYTLVAMGQRLALTRYIWLGLAGGLVSTVALLLPLTFGQLTLMFALVWGLGLAASGLLTLRQAVRRAASA